MYERGKYNSMCRLRQSESAGQSKQMKQAAQRDKTRILQLMVCMVLFLLVAVGNGVCPDKMERISCQIIELTTQDMDFRSAFAKLGSSVAGEGSSFEQLQEFCVEVFGPTERESTEHLDCSSFSEPTRLLSTEVQNLSLIKDTGDLKKHYLYSPYANNALPAVQLNFPMPETSLSQDAHTTGPDIPAVGTVVLDVNYEGEPLPANYTMNELSFGGLETVAPVIGHLNSEYGYRDHPVNGKYLFHGGVDIGGQSGDPIVAFASGIVDYVGENKSYGLYLQLDHGDGIKSFYAHCKSICVKKGQVVKVGEKIAEVGSSGTATGPHLHLELKYNDLHVNPAYYVEFLGT